MAEAVVAGAKRVDGTDVTLLQVQELEPAESLEHVTAKAAMLRRSTPNLKDNYNGHV